MKSLKILFIIISAIFLIAVSVFPTKINTAGAYAYQNHCWRCGQSINSNVNTKCVICSWYICKNCGACKSGCSRCPSWSGNSGSTTSNKNSNKSSSAGSVTIIIGVIVLVCFCVYRYKNNKR